MKEYKKPINERVGEVLKILQHSLTLTEIAVELGVSQPKLSEILAHRMAAGLDVICALCVRFSVSPDYLLLGFGSVFREKSENNTGSSEVVSLETYEKKVEECALLRLELDSLRSSVSAHVKGEEAVLSTGSLETTHI